MSSSAIVTPSTTPTTAGLMGNEPRSISSSSTLLSNGSGSSSPHATVSTPVLLTSVDSSNEHHTTTASNNFGLIMNGSGGSSEGDDLLFRNHQKTNLFGSASGGGESTFVGLASLINSDNSGTMTGGFASHQTQQPQQQHQCGLCGKEPMVNGKTLVGCWHSFCHACLNQAIASGRCQIQTSLNGLGSSIIVCPVCTQVRLISNLYFLF